MAANDNFTHQDSIVLDDPGRLFILGKMFQRVAKSSIKIRITLPKDLKLGKKDQARLDGMLERYPNNYTLEKV